MKKLCIVLVSIMILPFVLSATPMNVVGEVFTSTSCGYCPSARRGLRELAAEFDNVIPLIWQFSSGYVGMPSPHINTRATMYGVSGIPHARFSGYITEIGGNSGSMYNQYLPHYNTINALDSPLAIDIVMDYSSKSTLDVQADVEVTGDITTTNNKIVIIITNKYSDDYTCAVVAYHEEDFGLTTIGETGTYSTSFTFDDGWDMFEIKAVAIVQTFSADYAILQGATCYLNSIIPAFSSTIQSGPPQLGVQFYNESYPPSGATCEWDFDSDGTWDSTEENPYYYYDAIGTFDVTLRVTSGDNSETVMFEDYITVTNNSDINGTLSGKWTQAYSPYTITGDANIPEDFILEIEPNVEILTNNGSRITIEGYLSALGEENDHIMFTTDDEWKGISFSNSEYENILSYAEVTGAVDCAVDIDSSSVTISSCELYDNSISSEKGSAIAVTNADDVVIERNIISNNTSSNLCGAISLDNSSPLIERNIIVNNQASTAGAFSMKNGSCPELINNTIANNSSNYAFSLFSSSNPTIENCIIRHSGTVFVNFVSSPTVTYSDVSGGYAGTGNIDSDPLFVNPQNGDYRLSWTHHPVADSTKSPCIDAGNPESPYDPDGTIADMGALYFNQDIAVDDPEFQDVTLRSYPNPFRNETTISFYSKASNKPDCVTIYNIKGERVRTLELEPSVTGFNTIWDGKDASGKRVSSGIYFYKMDTGNHAVIKKMMVVK